jgi:hypothetical protein
MSVRDDRLPPFAWLALDALTTIRDKAPSAQVASTRNVYVALAEAASRALDGQQARFKTTRAELAHLAGVSTKTVDRCCAILAEIGLLSVDARVDDDGRTLPSVYRLSRGDIMSPPLVSGEDTESPPITHAGRNGKKTEAPTAQIAREAITYRGKRVPAAVADAATVAVTSWAQRTGQTLRPLTARGKPTESLTRVIGAMLDFPEVVELWPAMIDRALAAPWWSDDAPGVGVVFGPNVRERMIEQAKRPAIAASAAGNVHHIRPAGETRFDRAQESLRVLHDQLVAEGR